MAFDLLFMLLRYLNPTSLGEKTMISQFSDGDLNIGTRQEERAAYNAPKLLEYGALRDITLARGTGLKNDNSGGGAGANKTVA